MINIAIISALLFIPWFAGCLLGLDGTLGGRIGLCAVFLFTALGHFLKADEMLPMLPPAVPARRAVLYLSGVLEAFFAVGVVAFSNTAPLGWCIAAFLVAVSPANVYAAVRRIPFGGHSMGPRYLFLRLPLQLLLIGWTDWFTIRGR